MAFKQDKSVFRSIKIFSDDDDRKISQLTFWNRMPHWESFQGNFYDQVLMGSDSLTHKYTDIIT